MENIEEEFTQELLQELIKVTKESAEQNKEYISNMLWKNNLPSTIVAKRELERSADYIEQDMPNVTHFTSGMKYALYSFVPTKVTLDGYIAEFGVWQGQSINQLALFFYPKIIWGFDSFLGLEEDFSIDCLKGAFNLKGIPPLVRENVALVKGSFSKSLPDWLENNPGIFSFINIDCDTYQSTKTVLDLLGPERIVSGTVILFDEYLGFPGWEKHEFKAWKEYCNKNKIKYEYIAVCGYQVLIKIL
jgi:hypothetical protein